MAGKELAAVVTSEGREVSIRPEPGWHLKEATINVTIERDKAPRPRHRKDEPCSLEPPPPGD
jgi:hypothetical protein